MNKRLSKALLFGTLLLASTSVFVSCKDYDDDIKSLQEQINANNTVISTLKSAFDGGVVITNVTKDGSGVILSTSDGQTYRISNGQNGADAVVWTIGNDGYWYKDGVRTEYLALGTDGTAGAPGAPGADGKDADVWTIGDDGFWYLNGTKTKYQAVGTNGTNGSEWTIGSDGYWYKNGVKTEYKAAATSGDEVWTVVNGQVYRNGVQQSGFDYWEPGKDGYWYKNGVKQNDMMWASNDDAITVAMTKKGVVISGLEGGNIAFIPTVSELSSLVFVPQTYYWGIEAAKITRLTPQPYINVKELTSYIDNDAQREEVIGTKRATPNPENSVNYTDVDQDVNVHERYNKGAKITVMLDATAEYHINPTTAYFDELTKVSVLSKNQVYTRTKSNATVSLMGAADMKNGIWSVSNGILSVPLNVDGTVGTVENKADGTPDNSNSGVTTFATQVHYSDTTITSDYAAIIEETVSDLRLAHKPYKASAPRTVVTDFIQTGLLNTHCGQCEVYKLSGKNMGMHLFATVGEAKDFVSENNEGQDLVPYQEDINLTKLIETHYTNASGQHAKFEGNNFTRNFEYKFEMTDFRYQAGNQTNESAHAAIYQDENGDYWLHPQDPQEGGLNGRAYDKAKATEVVVNRVPLVRVSLIYKGSSSRPVVDYGYLPIRIVKEAEVPVPEEFITASYTSDKDAKVTRYNDCYTEGGSNIEAVRTDWRQTEEDLMSHEFFLNSSKLGRALTREEFEEHYTAQTDLDDLDQYYLTNETAWLANPKEVKPQFKPVDNTLSYRYQHIGKIAYVQGGIGSGGLGTSILTWNLTVNEIRSIAKVSGWSNVVRAILLKSDKTTVYPDLFIIFKTGNITIEDKDVVADMGVKAHRINEYWYTAGNAPFKQGDVEIHTNVITPEENGGTTGAPYASWKPLTFENYFRSVFLNNFNSGNFATWMKLNGAPSGTTHPFKAANMKLGIFFDDSSNGDYKGYMDAGAAKTFHVRNTVAGDNTKKNLYASLDNINWQKIASIDGTWNGTAADNDNLKNMKISLAETAYAKALLNYVDHEKIGEDGVLKATVNVVPVKQNGTAFDIQNDYFIGAVKYDHDGTTDYCKIKVTDYKFDVRFLRPVSISKLKEKEIEDATSSTNTTQKIKLSELVNGYTDFRGSQAAPNWKDTPISPISYEEYYAPLNTNKFTVRVQNLIKGQYLSENVNVETNLNQKDEDTFVPLNTVASEIIFQMIDDETIEYRNNGSTVQKFKIRIPVQVEYYWGTIYDKVTVTVKKTQANSRKK